MRFLAVHPGPNFSVSDVFNGWTAALRAVGHDVAVFNLDERLMFYEQVFVMVEDGKFRKAMPNRDAVFAAVNGLAASLYRLQPDVLFVVSGFFVDLDILDIARRRGTRVVLLNTESPYEEQRQLLAAEHADLVLLNDPTNIEAYAERTNAVYVPHAYWPAVHHPGPASEDLVCDFGFVGTGYASRVDFLERMTLPEDTILAGNWRQVGEDSPLRRFLPDDLSECFDNTDAADLYRSAKAGLNLYRREALDGDTAAGWAMGPREVEMAACGLFFLRDPRPEGDEVLHMLPTFASPEDASEQLAWWLAHDAEREKLARMAAEAVADRTFVRNVGRLSEALS